MKIIRDAIGNFSSAMKIFGVLFIVAAAREVFADTLSLASCASYQQAINVTYSNPTVVGNTLQVAIQIQNTSGSWVYIQEDTSSPNYVSLSSDNDNGVYLLGPGGTKTLNNVAFTVNSYLKFNVTTPIGLDFTTLATDPKPRALFGAMIVDCMTRGLLTFALPANAFDEPFNSATGVVDPLLDNIVSTLQQDGGDIGSAAVALKNRDWVNLSLDFGQIASQIASESSTLQNSISQLLQRQNIGLSSGDVGNFFSGASTWLDFIGQVLDVPAKYTLLHDISISTFGAPPTSWNRFDVVVTAQAPSVTSVSPPAFTGLPIGQTKLIRVIGSGFTGSSTLTFNDGVNPPYTGRVPTSWSANELDYYITTGTNQANWTVQVVNGAQTSGLGYFTVNAPSASPTATGSLVVNLSPSGTGAQWQVDGTGYNSSSQVVGYLTPGSHTVSFKPISGYATPANQMVTINANAQTTANATYTVIAPSTYTLTLNYNNTQGGASASPSANGNIYTAGALVQLYASASSGNHFTGWSGDVGGTNNPVTITMNGNKNVTANFASGDPTMGTVVVTIHPQSAATAGVTWGFNASDFRASGSGYTTFPATYILDIHTVSGWLGPSTVFATITAGQTTNVTVTFTPDTTPGLLTVTLSPPDAVAAGAQWHANGGAGQGSGASVALAPGNYTITFDPIPGWTAPANQTVTVQRSQTTIASGNYTPPAGLPSIVSIQPGVGVLTGGTELAIQGLNFVAPATVLVGGQPATNVQVLGGSQITCLTPSNSFYGTVPVVVQTTNGSATNLTSFAYGLPRGNGITLAGSIGGYIKAMAAQGNYGYAGEGSTFTVFDVSNPSAPTPIARLAMPGLVQDIAFFSAAGRQYAGVANNDAGLQIVDITTPTAPALRGYYNTGDYASGVAVLGSNAYVANGNSGMMILDVSNPLQPHMISSLSIGNCDRLLVQPSGTNTFAYVSDGGAVAVVDVTSSSNPLLLGTTVAITQSWEAHSLAFLNNRVFFADGYGYLQAVDVSNPNAPTALGAVTSDSPSAVATANGLIYTWATDGFQVYNFPGGPANRIGFAVLSTGRTYGDTMCILGGIALCTGGENGFTIYNVSTPSSPAFQGAYGATAGYYLAETISGTNAFVATQNSGLKIINVNNPAALSIQSQYIPSFNGGFGGQKVQIAGSRAYFVSAHQINILDVSNPQAPALLGANSTAQFLTAC